MSCCHKKRYRQEDSRLLSLIGTRINIDEGQTLNIYGQEDGTGRLEAKSNSYMSENPGSSEGSVMAAIGSRKAMGTLVIHGGNITANSSCFTAYTVLLELERILPKTKLYGTFRAAVDENRGQHPCGAVPCHYAVSG